MAAVTRNVCLYLFASVNVFTMLVSSKRVILKALTPNVTAKPGEEKVLGCAAQGVSPDPLLYWIKWKFGGKFLNTNRGRLVQNEDFDGSFGNFTLAIRNVTAADEGMYSCYVFSSGRQGIKDSMSLKVHDEPLISTASAQSYQPWSEVTHKPTPPRGNALVFSPSSQPNHTVPREKIHTQPLISTAGAQSYQPWSEVTHEPTPPRGNVSVFIPSSQPNYTVPIEKIHTQSSSGQQNLAMWAALGGVMGLGTTALAIYFFTKKKKFGSHNGTTIQNYQEYKYDVFVTYRSKDSEIWVKETLLPLLDENNLKYCVHDIHWEPGRYVNEQMAESVYQSRMVLVLLSKNYLKSNYCKEELYYAIYRNVERGDRSLIVMKFDNMNVKEIPKEIRNRTFIDTSWKYWKENLVKALSTYSKNKKETITDV